MKELEITIMDNGDIAIQGKNLALGESVKDVARFITDSVATVTETGHKQSQRVTEQSRGITRNT